MKLKVKDGERKKEKGKSQNILTWAVIFEEFFEYVISIDLLGLWISFKLYVIIANLHLWVVRKLANLIQKNIQNFKRLKNRCEI